MCCSEDDSLLRAMGGEKPLRWFDGPEDTLALFFAVPCRFSSQPTARTPAPDARPRAGRPGWARRQAYWDDSRPDQTVLGLLNRELGCKAVRAPVVHRNEVRQKHLKASTEVGRVGALGSEFKSFESRRGRDREMVRGGRPVDNSAPRLEVRATSLAFHGACATPVGMMFGSVTFGSVIWTRT